MERKKIIPIIQTRFRKGMRTMDNIYMLNYVANKQISRKRGNMVVLFADIRAVFYSVKRGY